MVEVLYMNCLRY